MPRKSLASLETLASEQAALRRVATLAARDPEPGALFQCVCEEIGGLLGVESTDMLRFEDDGRATIVAAWAADGTSWFPVGGTVPVDGESMSAKLRRSGRPARVDDYTDVSGELAASVRAMGVLSAVGAPVTVAGRLWGGIMASSADPYSFPDDTEQRMADFAELVTAALANADARERLAASRARIVEAGYEERRRLGRDLHDGAQQEFVGAAISLRLARQKCSDETADLLDAALEQVQAGIADLRRLAAGIHPSLLTDRGLPAALGALATRSPLQVELGTISPQRLPDSVETTAYYVVAEALTNAAKHSGCESVQVDLRVEDGWALVQVRDEGAGGADISAGSGLRGLADRVSALGGRLEIDSTAGQGTAVTARIALSP